MRWSRITALIRLGEDDNPAPVSAAADTFVLPSPSEYRRSSEVQRSRLGYTIAVAAAILTGLATVWLPPRATPLFERLVFGPRPQSRPALAKDAAATPGRQTPVAVSTAPTPAPAAPALQPGSAGAGAVDQPQSAGPAAPAGRT